MFPLQAAASAASLASCTILGGGGEPKRARSQPEAARSSSIIVRPMHAPQSVCASADSHLRACNFHTLLPLPLHGQRASCDSSASDSCTDHEPPPCWPGPILLLWRLVDLISPCWR